MQASPKVSVVLPTFNRADELQRAIHSVLSQTFNDFELIVVDDSSTDYTEEVVRAIDDSRIRYEKLAKNVGGAEARNVGIRIARGEIIAFQDSDDEWTVTKLARTVVEFESDAHVGYVFSSYVQVWDSGCRKIPLTGDGSFRQERFYESLLWRNVVGTPTLAVRKSLLATIGGFDGSMPRYQDWELALRLARVAKAKYIAEPLLLAYTTPKSITQDQHAHRVALQKIYDKHAGTIDQNQTLKAAWMYRIGDAMLSTGQSDGRYFLWNAILNDPFNPKYLAKALFSIPGHSGFYSIVTSVLRKQR